MRFSILRFVSYFLILAWDRQQWLLRWHALSPRRQYLAQVATLIAMLVFVGVSAYKENLLTSLGFICEVTGLASLLAAFWRWSPLITARLRQHRLFALALLTVNAMALYKMPYGQRAISMATSSLATFGIYVIVSKLGKTVLTVCCCCFGCCREICTDAGDLPQLPAAVS